MESVNPYTKKSLHKYDPTSPEEVDRKLTLATQAFLKTRRISNDDRKKLFIKTADLLKEQREKLAKLAVEEMGKTLTAARAEVEKCEATTRYFAEQIDAINRAIPVESSKAKQFIK